MRACILSLIFFGVSCIGSQPFTLSHADELNGLWTGSIGSARMNLLLDGENNRFRITHSSQPGIIIRGTYSLKHRPLNYKNEISLKIDNIHTQNKEINFQYPETTILISTEKSYNSKKQLKISINNACIELACGNGILYHQTNEYDNAQINLTELKIKIMSNKFSPKKTQNLVCNYHYTIFPEIPNKNKELSFYFFGRFYMGNDVNIISSYIDLNLWPNSSPTIRDVQCNAIEGKEKLLLGPRNIRNVTNTALIEDMNRIISINDTPEPKEIKLSWIKSIEKININITNINSHALITTDTPPHNVHHWRTKISWLKKKFPYSIQIIKIGTILPLHIRFPDNSTHQDIMPGISDTIIGSLEAYTIDNKPIASKTIICTLGQHCRQ